MSEEKQNRIKKLKKDDDKKRSIAGEFLARNLISKYCNISPELIYFEIDKHGKPRARGLNVEFNISHSKEVVACCVDKVPVGIDVEFIKPVNIGCLSKICTEKDLFYLFIGSNSAKTSSLNSIELEMFYRIWTAKEAYFKMVGTGITNLKSISIQEIPIKFQSLIYKNYVVTVVS